MRRHLGLRADEQELDGSVGRRVAARMHHRTVGENGGIDRPERVVAVIGKLGEPTAQEAVVGGERARQIADLDPRRRSRAGQPWRVPAVDEHESRGDLGNGERLDRLRRRERRRAGRPERELVERREIGEPPVLVARRGKRQRIGALERLAAQRVQPGERPGRRRRMPGQQAFQESRRRARAHRVTRPACRASRSRGSRARGRAPCRRS